MAERTHLSFEDFADRSEIVVRYNNLYLHFVTTGAGPDYRGTGHFRRFLKEHPRLEEKLREGIMGRSESEGTSASLKPFDEDLYEAYKIMRSYGASDRDLFK
jgi:hypothetical protein